MLNGKFRVISHKSHNDDKKHTNGNRNGLGKINNWLENTYHKLGPSGTAIVFIIAVVICSRISAALTSLIYIGDIILSVYIWIVIIFLLMTLVHAVYNKIYGLLAGVSIPYLKWFKKLGPVVGPAVGLAALLIVQQFISMLVVPQ